MPLLLLLIIGRARSSDARESTTPGGLDMTLFPLSGLETFRYGTSTLGNSNLCTSPAALVTIRPGGPDIMFFPFSALNLVTAASVRSSNEGVGETLQRKSN